MGSKWQDFDTVTADLADVADNAPDHSAAVIAARALAYILWQKSVIEELKGTVATLEHWQGR